MNLTDKEILNIKNDSLDIVNLKTQITNEINTLNTFDTSIINGLADDDVDRKPFLSKIGLVNGLATEYRNIYGVEVPIYEITSGHKIQLQDDSYGNEVYTEERDDCQEIINSAQLIDDNESALFTRFYIDDKASEKSSSFYLPMCPPGFDRWAGEFLYSNVCREYDLTEYELSNFLTKGTTATTPTFSIFKNGDGNELSSKHPLKVNCDETGTLNFNKWTYDISDDELKTYCSNGGGIYSPDNAIDFSPIEYLDNEHIDYLIDKNTVFRYDIITIENSKMIGYGYLSVKKTTDGKMYLNMIKQNGKLTSDSYRRYRLIRNHKAKWYKPWTWFIYTKVTDYRKFKLDLYPVDITATDYRQAVISLYKNIIEKALINYRKVNKSKLDADTIKSIDMMEELFAAMNIYISNGEGYDNLLRLIKSRYIWLYTAINIVIRGESVDSWFYLLNSPSSILQIVKLQDRANKISTYLSNNKSLFEDAFSSINSRINKREGSLTKIYNVVKSKKVIGDSINLKKSSCASKQAYMYSFKCLTNGDDKTNKVIVSIEDWEDDTTVYNALSRSQKIYLVSDKSIDEFSIIDINKIITYDTVDGIETETDSNKFEIILTKKIPSSFLTEDTLRLVKVIT